MHFSTLLAVGLATRLALLAWGTWQDAHMAVRYTDIDYEVYTDAAAFMVVGKSPFLRSTYRYTPLLSAALMPNIWLHKSFGKVLFTAADLTAAALFAALLRRQANIHPKHQNLGISIWLFSPFTVSISTRGNGEALVTCMLLGMLWCIAQNWIFPAAVLFGLAVHWRIYPIIFALPLLRYFALQASHQALTTAAVQKGSNSKSATIKKGLKIPIDYIISWQGIGFGLLSGATFFGLGAWCYSQYGWQFLHEAYLYHLERTDKRHNFSPFFYPAFLKFSQEIAAGDDGQGLFSLAGNSGWAFSVGQGMTVLATGWAFAADLPLAMLLQTLCMVAFNKVCTAQYFVWYLSFLPLVLPKLLTNPNKGRLVAPAATWAASLGNWLFWAYLLEFKGLPVYVGVWVSGLVYTAANAWLLVRLMALCR